jgi:hypothetical protein
VLAVLVPSYLWLGKPALTALTYRSGRTSADNFYQIFTRALSGQPTLPAVVPVAAVACVAVACLLLWRLPGGPRALPAVRPALAVSLAWLFFWPYQRPWYDAMMICLLALYPATAIDWPVLARLVAGTFFTTPGMPGRLPRGVVHDRPPRPGAGDPVRGRGHPGRPGHPLDGGGRVGAPGESKVDFTD